MLVRHSYRKLYSLPGSYVARGERKAAAARRELLEETGISVAADQLLFRRQWTSTDGRSTDHCSLFECQLVRPPLLAIDNREVIAAQFVTRQEALDLPLAKHVREYLSGIQ